MDNLWKSNRSGLLSFGFNPDIAVGTEYDIPFKVSEYSGIAVLAKEIYGDNTRGIFHDHWNLSGNRSFWYHLMNYYSVQFIINRETNKLIITRNNTSASRSIYINGFTIWGVK